MNASWAGSVPAYTQARCRTAGRRPTGLAQASLAKAAAEISAELAEPVSRLAVVMALTRSIDAQDASAKGGVDPRSVRAALGDIVHGARFALVDIYDIVGRAVGLAKPYLKDRAVQLNSEPGPHLLVVGDQHLLVEALSEGMVALASAAPQHAGVHCHSERRGRTVRISLGLEPRASLAASTWEKQLWRASLIALRHRGHLHLCAGRAAIDFDLPSPWP